MQRIILDTDPGLDDEAISIVVVRRFGAREIAPQGQEVESTRTS